MREKFPLTLPNLGFLATSLLLATTAAAQDVSAPARHWGSLPRVESDSVERLRNAELGAGMSSARLLLRSPSSLAESDSASPSPRALSLISPYLYFVRNSELPFSINDGSVWAGRGMSTLLTTGFRVQTSFLQVIVAPELVSIQNQYFAAFDTLVNSAPALPDDRSRFGFPYYAGANVIDLPVRFGEGRITRVYPGQSSVTVHASSMSAGVSTENEWWGPGIRNALLLSNNAPGFPHAFIRTRRPLATRLGDFEARWVLGELRESDFFDTASANDHRSFNAAALTLRPRRAPNLVLGFARAVYGTSTGSGDLFASAFDVVRPSDSDESRSRAQVIALFGRWILPASGFEVYTELARTARPRSLRDLLLAPNHTQGYTLGLQWHDRGRSIGPGALRVQGEVTNVEKSPTFRERPSHPFYVNPGVPQGYTHRGEALGAAIGPGASSQYAATDYVTDVARIGIYAGRIRWNQDVHITLPDAAQSCNVDVSVYLGGRAAARTRFGTLSADFMRTKRLNPYFERRGCPAGPARYNNTVVFTWTPVP